MAKRIRNHQIKLWVSEREMKLIRDRMVQMETENLSAYLRKMAIDGYMVKLEVPELKEMISLMRYSCNNINQIAKRLHQTGRIYDADLDTILRKQDELWKGLSQILTRLGQLS